MTTGDPQRLEPDLAPYAIDPAHCRLREHGDPFADPSQPLAVDRHRVLHSAAFRRLQYKTQVFLTNEGDHFRTRLTHTLEVANIARCLARRLRVNTDLAEIVALAHDVGHPPFGHAGESQLGRQMADHGGFDHNRHSLRVVDYLEHPYPPFRGLNLTRAVREAMAKHTSQYDRPSDHPLADGRTASLEGQIASLADRVAYNCHDVEDALAAGITNEGELASLTLWRQASEPIRRDHGNAPTPAVRRPILDRLLAVILDDVAEHTHRAIASAGIATPADVAEHRQPLVALSPTRLSELQQLEAFLRERIYSHRTIIRMDTKARRFVSALFGAYLDEPRLLPERFARRIDEQGTQRVVCDYIAGMTDRFCQDEYQRLFQPFERV